MDIIIASLLEQIITIVIQEHSLNEELESTLCLLLLHDILSMVSSMPNKNNRSKASMNVLLLWTVTKYSKIIGCLLINIVRTKCNHIYEFTDVHFIFNELRKLEPHKTAHVLL